MYIYITHTYSRVQNKVSITILLHNCSTMFTVSVPFPVFNPVFAAQRKHSENTFEKRQTPFQFSGVTGATAVPRGTSTTDQRTPDITSHRDTLPPCPPDISLPAPQTSPSLPPRYLPPCPPDIASHSDCGSRCLGDREGACLCDS